MAITDRNRKKYSKGINGIYGVTLNFRYFAKKMLSAKVLKIRKVLELLFYF